MRLRPQDADSLAKALNTLHMRYSQYFNGKKNRHGHLWQGRFYSTILDDRHALEAMRYDETNPVRRGLVETLTAYPWSAQGDMPWVCPIRSWRPVARSSTRPGIGKLI